MNKLQAGKRSSRQLGLLTYLATACFTALLIYQHEKSLAVGASPISLALPTTAALALGSPLPGPSYPTNYKRYRFFDDGHSYHDTNNSCPVPWEWTSNATEADVIWHNVLDSTTQLRRLFPEQKFAFMSLESRLYYPYITEVKANYGYDFSVDYRIWKDHPAGPADIPAVYLTNPTSPDFNIDFRKPPLMPKRRDALMAAFISNCDGLNKRNELLAGLMKRFPVHSYGGCLNNAQEPSNNAGMSRPALKQHLSSQYFFLFTPENSNDMSYVTEKVYDALAAGTIPVYYGATDIVRFVPDPSAIINAADFSSADALADYLLELSNDEQKYMRHFDWKNKEFSSEFKRILRLASRTVQCRLAMALEGLDFEKDLQGLEIFPPNSTLKSVTY